VDRDHLQGVAKRIILKHRQIELACVMNFQNNSFNMIVPVLFIELKFLCNVSSLCLGRNIFLSTLFSKRPQCGGGGGCFFSSFFFLKKRDQVLHPYKITG
jgi:hypothetical protein